MSKTCETCKHFLQETRRGGVCAIKPIYLDNRGKPIISMNGEPMPFYTYCSHKACLRHEEKRGIKNE